MNAIAIYGHRIPLAIPSFSSRDMNDFGVVCLWTLIGLMLSISAGIFDYGADIATVLAMANRRNPPTATITGTDLGLVVR